MRAGGEERVADTVDGLQREVAELQRSRNRLIIAADEDRRQIERALHDGVQQDLVALAVNLQRVTALLETDPDAAKALLDELTTNVRQALDNATQLAQRIYPPLLETRGLPSSLRSAAEKAGITARVEVLSAASYPPEITVAVYWCCAEALSSAEPGTDASVSVRDADGDVAFEARVAGRFSEQRLQHLRDRVEALGGSLAEHDEPDGTSRLSGSLPLARRT